MLKRKFHHENVNEVYKALFDIFIVVQIRWMPVRDIYRLTRNFETCTFSEKKVEKTSCDSNDYCENCVFRANSQKTEIFSTMFFFSKNSMVIDAF